MEAEHTSIETAEERKPYGAPTLSKYGDAAKLTRVKTGTGTDADKPGFEVRRWRRTTDEGGS